MGREVAPNLAHFYGVFDLLRWLAGLASGCYSSGYFTTLHGSGCAIARGFSWSPSLLSNLSGAMMNLLMGCQWDGEWTRAISREIARP